MSHAALANLVGWHGEAFGLRAGERTTQVAGLGFDATVWELWGALAHGAEVHLLPEGLLLEPAGVAASREPGRAAAGALRSTPAARS